MRRDAPSALPLIGFATALASSASVVAPRWTACGFAILFVLCALRKWRAAAVLCLSIACGLSVGVHHAAVDSRDAAAFGVLPRDRFVVVEAPLDRDWSPRGGGWMLRVARFRIGGQQFDRELTLYMHSHPPPALMHARIVAEGFLREGYVMTVKSVRLIRYDGEVAAWTPAGLNRLFAMRLDALARTHPSRAEGVALAEALALGRSERLTESLRDSYKRGGTYHLLVFSGLQIAFAAGALALLLRWLHAPRAADWLLLSFAVLAPLYIGATASVARASLAIGLYAFSRLIKRPTTVSNLWCVSAMLRLIFVPGDLADVSFHLTYAGSGALLFLANKGKHRKLAAIVAAELALTPLTLFHFHQYALGGSILTIVLAPLIMAMLAASALLCLVPCLPLLVIIGALNSACEAINAVGANAAGMFAAPPPAALVIGYLLAFLAISFERRYLAMVLLLIPSVAAIVRDHRAARLDTPHFVMLDVGQGDSLLARAGGKVLLVDGGGRMGDERFGESTLLPMLVDRGVRHIDVVVLTHPHPDHCGGLPAVITRLDAGEVWLSPRRFRGECAQQILAACLARHVPVRALHGGESRAIGPMRTTVFLADRLFKRGVENNASVVLSLVMGGRTFLLTGDIEREAESVLASPAMRADVLKVAHHGSRTSSTEAFLDAVRPRLALVSCGRNNQFGHPHAQTVNALAARGVKLWRTDRDGVVDVEVRSGHLFVRGKD